MQKGGQDPPKGLLAGIAIATAFATVFLGLSIFLVYRRCQYRKDQSQSKSHQPISKTFRCYKNQQPPTYWNENPTKAWPDDASASMAHSHRSQPAKGLETAAATAPPDPCLTKQLIAHRYLHGVESQSREEVKQELESARAKAGNVITTRAPTRGIISGPVSPQTATTPSSNTISRSDLPICDSMYSATYCSSTQNSSFAFQLYIPASPNPNRHREQNVARASETTVPAPGQTGSLRPNPPPSDTSYFSFERGQLDHLVIARSSLQLQQRQQSDMQEFEHVDFEQLRRLRVAAAAENNDDTRSYSSVGTVVAIEEDERQFGNYNEFLKGQT